MKKLILLFLLPIALQAQSAPDSIKLYGYFYNIDLTPAENATIYMKRVAKTYANITTTTKTFKTDSTGYGEIYVPRNSIAWIYGAVYGFDSTSNGVPYIIPDSTTADFRYLDKAYTGWWTAQDTTGMNRKNEVTALENDVAGKAGADSVHTELAARVSYPDSGDVFATPTSIHPRVGFLAQINDGDTLYHGMIVSIDTVQFSTDSLKVVRAPVSSEEPIGVVYNPWNILGVITDTTVWIVTGGLAEVLIEEQDSVYAVTPGAGVRTSATVIGRGTLNYGSTNHDRQVGQIVQPFLRKEGEYYVLTRISTR